MFGSRRSDGAASTPATAPSAAASPQPTASIVATFTPSQPRLERVGCGAQAEPDLRALEEQSDEGGAGERHADHAEVLLRKRGAAEVDGRGRERP